MINDKWQRRRHHGRVQYHVLHVLIHFCSCRPPYIQLPTCHSWYLCQSSGIVDNYCQFGWSFWVCCSLVGGKMWVACALSSNHHFTRSCFLPHSITNISSCCLCQGFHFEYHIYFHRPHCMWFSYNIILRVLTQLGGDRWAWIPPQCHHGKLWKQTLSLGLGNRWGMCEVENFDWRVERFGSACGKLEVGSWNT